MPNEVTPLERQYKLAIDARDKLNDNYHKWMTFYYVANGAVLVAITTLYGKSNNEQGIFLLGLIGIFICILWNLSCKGYYYWSNSWIDIIINLEKKVTQDNKELYVYTAFSQKVVDNEKYSWMPLKPANISTPKLTLLFSFFSIISWSIFSSYQFLTHYFYLCLCCRITLTSILLITVLVAILIIPKLVISRPKDKHTLVGNDE